MTLLTHNVYTNLIEKWNWLFLNTTFPILTLLNAAEEGKAKSLRPRTLINVPNRSGNLSVSLCKNKLILMSLSVRHHKLQDILNILKS